MTTIKKHFYTILASIALSTIITASTQAQESNSQLEKIVTKVDTKANYPGGIRAFHQYFIDEIGTTLQTVKIEEGQTKIEVAINFFIDTDGSLVDISIVRSNLEESINQKMIEVIQNSVKWTPAIQNGQAIKSQLTLPITLKTKN